MKTNYEGEDKMINPDDSRMVAYFNKQDGWLVYDESVPISRRYSYKLETPPDFTTPQPADTTALTALVAKWREEAIKARKKPNADVTDAARASVYSRAADELEALLINPVWHGVPVSGLASALQREEAALNVPEAAERL